MTKTITFNELRRVKDSLPDGAMQRIADELNLKVETVRNYFGGANFRDGRSAGLNYEPGPDGGIVMLNDLTIWEKAKEILEEAHRKMPEAFEIENENNEPEVEEK